MDSLFLVAGGGGVTVRALPQIGGRVTEDAEAKTGAERPARSNFPPKA